MAKRRNLPPLIDLAPKIAASLNNDPTLVAAFVQGLTRVEPKLDLKPEESGYGSRH
jgi:hypothetical protein